MSETNSPLINSIPGYENYVDHRDKVSDYVNNAGDWDRSKLEMWFHPHEVERIVSVHPPVRREERISSFGNHPLMTVFLLNLHIFFFLQVPQGVLITYEGAFGDGKFQKR